MSKNENKLNTLINLAKWLTDSEMESIIENIYDKLSTFENPSDIDSSVYAFTNNEDMFVCKHCGSTHIVKNGHDRHNHTRYLCRDCNKTFSNTSMSTVSGTHKDAFVWKEFICSTLKSESLAQCAAKCNIAISTAFIWRHKILSAFSTVAFADSFDGMLEMDEMFVRISYKGNHKNSRNFEMPRKAYKRGSDNRIPGNNSKACVLCVAERNKRFSGIVSCRGIINLPLLKNIFDEKISKDSIVLTDGLRAYNQYFSNTEIEHIALPSLENNKPTVKGAYHINNVNSLHQRFRRFLRKYNGVATKYLQNYLSLFLWLENNKGESSDTVCTELCEFGTKMTSQDFKQLAPTPDFAPAA